MEDLAIAFANANSITDTVGRSAQFELAQFEQLLSDSSDDEFVLANPMQNGASGVGGAMQSVVSHISLLSEEHKNVVETTMKTFATLDPNDPRASITKVETMMAFSMAQFQMNLASNMAKASKQSLDTLLRSQG